MTVTQDRFRTALMDPAQPVPSGLSDGIARPAGARFNVYRNNVAVSLTEAMHTGFPVITKLLGTENMDGLAGLFLRAHPPASPVMVQYGAALPDFLAGMEQLSHLGYLPDVARLELAIRQSYHAADSTPIAAQMLATIPPETLLATTVSFAASLQVLRSDWPIYDIWRFNMQDNAPSPQPGAQDVLITRPDFDPVPNLLPAGGADWIKALMSGATIGDALDVATATTPHFDPGATLALLLQDGAITSLTMKE